MTEFLVAARHGLLLANLFAILATALLTTWITNKARADFREDVVAAVRVTGLSGDAIAAITRTARTRLSRQLTGYAPCSFLGRLPDLPDLELTLLKLRARRHGLVVIEVAELQQLVHAVLELVPDTRKREKETA